MCTCAGMNRMETIRLNGGVQVVGGAWEEVEVVQALAVVEDLVEGEVEEGAEGEGVAGDVGGGLVGVVEGEEVIEAGNTSDVAADTPTNFQMAHGDSCKHASVMSSRSLSLAP